MRRFVFVSHTVPQDGAWSLEDLPGSGGRVDVLCRNLQAALHLSHGIRPDVDAYCVLVAPGGKPRTVRVQGSRIQRLNPDERSTAARLQQALRDSGAGPDWKEVQGGLAVADLGLADILGDLGGTLMLLDPAGAPVEEAAWPEDPVFLLSDHVPFTPEEYALFDGRRAVRVSLGAPWYHGNHVVAVVQHRLDRALGTPQVR